MRFFWHFVCRFYLKFFTMKNLIFLFFALMMALSCTPQKQVADNGKKYELKPTKNEDGEWDLDVIDDRYDYFLTAVAKPMTMYSESYLKSKNAMLVSEWNALYYSGRYRNIIESSIDYDLRENYGLKFEYKLYQVLPTSTGDTACALMVLVEQMQGIKRASAVPFSRLLQGCPLPQRCCKLRNSPAPFRRC